MVDHIFRQYDIRGKIGSELLLEDIYPLTQAIGYYFKQQNPHCTNIVVGADGRIHSPAIKERVCAALQDSGFDVIFIGTCPTPVTYFSLHTLSIDGALMITASHNGKEYNGIKICLGKSSVWGEQIQEIKQLAHQKAALHEKKRGNYREYPLINDYIDWLKNHFAHLVGCQISCVLDCGNAAGGTVMPALIKAMNWQNIELLCAEVDGNYPHHDADPTVPENMRDVRAALHKNKNYTFGAGLDGDCDRMAVMTTDGELVQGDKLLAVFAQELLQKYPAASVVFDIKCSSGLADVINAAGGKPHVSPSGHSLIKKAMKEHTALLAGELSCHFFFHDRYFGYDDGIYAFMRLVEILEKTGKTVQELLAIFPQKFNTPEIRLACDEERKETIVAAVKEQFLRRNDATIMTIDGIRVVLPYGWGILRSSNTQPVICLRCESDSVRGLEQIKNDFIGYLTPFFDEIWLKKQVNT